MCNSCCLFGVSICYYSMGIAGNSVAPNLWRAIVYSFWIRTFMQITNSRFGCVFFIQLTLSLCLYNNYRQTRIQQFQFHSWRIHIRSSPKLDRHPASQKKTMASPLLTTDSIPDKKKRKRRLATLKAWDERRRKTRITRPTLSSPKEQRHTRTTSEREIGRAHV